MYINYIHIYNQQLAVDKRKFMKKADYQIDNRKDVGTKVELKYFFISSKDGGIPSTEVSHNVFFP